MSWSWIVDPPHVEVVSHEVPICACTNFDIVGVQFDSKLTSEAHVRRTVSPRKLAC